MYNVQTPEFVKAVLSWLMTDELFSFVG